MTRILGIETSCDETSAAVIDDSTGDAHARVARDPFAGRASRLRRRRAGDRVARASHRDRARRRARRSRSPASTRDRARRDRGDDAPGLVGALLVGRQLRERNVARARHADRAGASHGRPPVRDVARASARGAAVHRAARLRRTHAAARRPEAGAATSCSARRATTRPAKRSTRSRSCSASPILAAATSSARRDR